MKNEEHKILQMKRLQLSYGGLAYNDKLNYNFV